jgi:21S rRNA (GM2251-2'-O)-methyltransferase
LDEDTQSLDSVCVDTPTILVLGNEGSGVRGSVLKVCTHLVKVDRATGAADNEELSVDSLNVSTTGGIVLHHFLKGKKRQL